MKKLCMLAIALISSSYGSDESKENGDATSAYASTGSIALSQHIEADRLPTLPLLPGSVEKDKILPLLMGFSETVGINSAVLRSFKNQSHFDPMIIDVDISPFLTGFRSDEIYQALGSRDNDELLKTWLEDAGLCSADMGVYFRSLIISKLKRVPTSRLAGVINGTVKLITAGMGGPDAIRIIYALSWVPDDKVNVVVTSSLQLITDDMDSYDRSRIVYALEDIPAKDIPDRLAATAIHYEKFITANMSGKSCSYIISALVKVPADKLECVVASALKVMVDDIDAHAISEIISELVQVPADKLESVVASVLKIMFDGIDCYDISEIISEVASRYEKKCCNIL